MTAPKPAQPSSSSQPNIFAADPVKHMRQSGFGAGAFSLLTALAFMYIGYWAKASAPFMIAALELITAIIWFVCRDERLINSLRVRVILCLTATNVTLVSYGLLLEGASLPAALAILGISILIASTLLEGAQVDTAIFIGIIAAAISAILGVYQPAPTIDAGAVSHLGYLIFVTVMIILAILTQRKIISLPLRIRLMIIALVLVIIPVSLLSVINNRSLRVNQQAETNVKLMNSARLFGKQIDDFVQGNRASIASQALLPIYSDYLHLARTNRYNSTTEENLIASLESFRSALKVKERAFFTSIALLDLEGRIAYTTNAYDIGWSEKDADYFKLPIATGRAFVSDVMFSTADHNPYIIFSAPVRDENADIIGVLRSKFDARMFQNLAEEYSGTIDQANYPILLDQDHMRLAQPYRPQLLYATLASLAPEQINVMRDSQRLPRVLTSTNLADMDRFVGGYKENPYYTGWSDSDRRDQMAVIRINSQPWYVVFVQDEGVLLAQLEEQTNLAILIAAILCAVLSLAAMSISRTFSNPINQLTQSALQISTGQLDAKVSVSGLPEFQLLGRTFEQMAAQIQQMVASLEDRVAERTRALESQNDALVLRARQFSTVADVARGVAAARELQELLHNVTVLVSERFGFYHAGIFLVDDMREYAVLRAANSEGGQRMLARGHRLGVGQSGIVGHVTATGEARIATDVGQDAVFFNNPDLAATRSEMAVPLRVGDQIIGALDVQSDLPDAFSEEDTQLFTILADQVAIAIYNSRLYAEMSQALRDAQVVHQRYLQQEWTRETGVEQHSAYRYTRGAVAAANPLQLPDVQDAVEFGEPVATQDSGGARVLSVPVKLRGETIAVIRLQESAEEGQEWHPEEVETVKEVADQVALALENARLFTQTARRAERERKVLEITSKIREHNDPQTMLRVAVEELQKALKASRAQVVLQPGDAASVAGGNGHNGHHGA